MPYFRLGRNRPFHYAEHGNRALCATVAAKNAFWTKELRPNERPCQNCVSLLHADLDRQMDSAMALDDVLDSCNYRKHL